jgi:SAM-dependent methyltransferase
MKKNFKSEIVKFYLASLGENKKILDLNPGFKGIYNNLKGSKVEYVCLEQNPHIRSFLENSNIAVKNWEIPNIPLEDDSIDYVLSAPFIEHLPTYIDALNFLLEVMRVVKPGGKVLLIVPNYLSIKEIFFEDYKHGWITTKKRIIDMLSDCHYEVLGYRYTIGWITMRMNPLTAIFRIIVSLIMATLRINIIERFLEAIKLDTLTNKFKKTFFELVVVEAQVKKSSVK